MKSGTRMPPSKGLCVTARWDSQFGQSCVTSSVMVRCNIQTRQSERQSGATVGCDRASRRASSPALAAAQRAVARRADHGTTCEHRGTRGGSLGPPATGCVSSGRVQRARGKLQHAAFQGQPGARAGPSAIASWYRRAEVARTARGEWTTVTSVTSVTSPRARDSERTVARRAAARWATGAPLSDMKSTSDERSIAVARRAPIARPKAASIAPTIAP